MLPPTQHHLAATTRQDGMAEHTEVENEFAALKKLGLVLMSDADVPRLLKTGAATHDSQQHQQQQQQQQQQMLLPPLARHACASCSQEFDSRLALSIHIGRVHKEYGPTAFGPSAGRSVAVGVGGDGSGGVGEAVGSVTSANKRNHTCHLCDKSFFSASYLSQHLRIHSGLKPYGCQVCSRRFTQLSHLQQHRRTHTGERPYKCKHPGCTKAFSQLSNLQSHSRSHMTDKTYKCTSCYKCFLDKDGLLSHVATHLGTRRVRAYACHLCDKSYTQDTYLQNHVKVKHAAGGGSSLGEKRKTVRPAAPLLATSDTDAQPPALSLPGLDIKSMGAASSAQHRLAAGHGASPPSAAQQQQQQQQQPPPGQLQLQRSLGKTQHREQVRSSLSPIASSNVALGRLSGVGGTQLSAPAVVEGRYGGHTVSGEHTRQQHFLPNRNGNSNGCSLGGAEESASAQPRIKARQVSAGPLQKLCAANSVATDCPSGMLRPAAVAAAAAADRASSNDVLPLAGSQLDKTQQTVAIVPPTQHGHAGRPNGSREKSSEHGSSSGSPLSINDGCKPDAIGSWPWVAGPVTVPPAGSIFGDAVAAAAAAGYSLPYHHASAPNLQTLHATLTSSATFAPPQHDQFRWSSCAAEPDQQQPQQRGYFAVSAASGGPRSYPPATAFAPPYWFCADGPYRQVAAAGALGFGRFGGSCSSGSNSSVFGQGVGSGSGGNCGSIGLFDGLSGALPSPYGLAMGPSAAAVTGYADQFAHQSYHAQPQSEALALTKLAGHSSALGVNGGGGPPGAGGGLIFPGI